MHNITTSDYYLRECSQQDFRLDGIRKVILPRLQGHKVLELGVGTGHLTKELLLNNYSVTAVDNDEHILKALAGQNPQACSQRQLQLLKVDLNQPEKLPEQRQTSIIGVDILEHIKDDARLIQELARRQRGGDQLVVLVPLYPRFFSEHDQAVGHVRRYIPKELIQKLNNAGYKVSWARRWNAPGYIANSIKPGAGVTVRNDQIRLNPLLKQGPVSYGLRWWLGAVESRVNFGFGLSFIVDARRV